jgi:hypothetical protein
VLELDCRNGDNAEAGCCCNLGAHTYRFEPRQVDLAQLTFDTGRGLDCRSDVEVAVLVGGEWQRKGRYSAVSSQAGSEKNPIRKTLTLGEVISGVRIDDDCKCCIDASSVRLNGDGPVTRSPRGRPTPWALEPALPPPAPTLHHVRTHQLWGEQTRGSGPLSPAHTDSRELELPRSAVVTRVEGSATSYCIWSVARPGQGARKVICGGRSRPIEGEVLQPDVYVVLPGLEQYQRSADVTIHLEER